MDITDLDRFKAGGFPSDYPPDSRMFFAGDDDVHGVIVAVLKAATRRITVAMYGYDDPDASALILSAMRRAGMVVQVTLDSSQAGGVHERKLLGAYLDPATDTPLSSVVSIGRSEHGAIMHLKMLVIDGEWVVSGSTNWSGSGESKQSNQLTVTRSRALAFDAEHEISKIHLDQLQKAHAKEAAHASH